MVWLSWQEELRMVPGMARLVWAPGHPFQIRRPWRLQMQSDEQAIREVHTTWIDAVNAGDLPRLLGLMTDDVAFLAPGQPPVGREGFPARFSGGHQQFRINCISELQEIVVAGNIAHTVSKDSLSLTSRAGGQTSRLAGDRLTIYRKQPDGRWLLARDAHTLAPVGP
jgi:uncharacterized protein (TIGR02246 family)